MAGFVERTLETQDVWRAIVLYGQNVATYKFALAKSLLDLAQGGAEVVMLEDLAAPFAEHICEHLKVAKKQITSRSSTFLDACRAFNGGDVSRDQLLDTTTRHGFVNVIGAFHIVNRAEVPARFFHDERAGKAKGIRLSDELKGLRSNPQFRNLEPEVESRWRLVETAWSLGMPGAALTVEYDPVSGLLLPDRRRSARRAVTAARDALNGYQQGKCFYCNATVHVDSSSDAPGDVDHFFPHTLKREGFGEAIDGVWNLVLACQYCNRGPNGKFARIPKLTYLEKLNARNTFLIDSHHPLRETLQLQTGRTQIEREAFLNRTYNAAKRLLIHTWAPPELEGDHAF